MDSSLGNEFLAVALYRQVQAALASLDVVPVAVLMDELERCLELSLSNVRQAQTLSWSFSREVLAGTLYAPPGTSKEPS